MQLDFERFTASEAEAITRVSQDNVRNWRRQRYLPPITGHARLNIVELAMLQVMGGLSERNIGIKVSTPFAREAAKAIYMTLVWSRKAFPETAFTLATQDAEARIGAAKIASLAKSIKLTKKFAREAIVGIDAQEQLADAALRLVGLNGLQKPAWAIAWANGEMEFAEDLSFLDENHEYADPYLRGPVILLSLGAQAQMLVDALPRPAFRLKDAV